MSGNVQAFDTELTDLERSIINYTTINEVAVTKRSAEQVKLHSKAEDFLRENCKQAVEAEIRDDILRINKRKLVIAEFQQKLESPTLRPRPYPSSFIHEEMTSYIHASTRAVLELYAMLETVETVTTFIENRLKRIKEVVNLITPVSGMYNLVVPTDLGRTLQYHQELEQTIKTRIKAFEYATEATWQSIKVNVEALQKNL